MMTGREMNDELKKEDTQQGMRNHVDTSALKRQVGQSVIIEMLNSVLSAARVAYPQEKLRGNQPPSLKGQYADVLTRIDPKKIDVESIPGAFESIQSAAKSIISSPTGAFNSGASPQERNIAAGIIKSIAEITGLCTKAPLLSQKLLSAYDSNVYAVIEASLMPVVEKELRDEYKSEYDTMLDEKNRAYAELKDEFHQMELELARLREVEKSGKKIEELARQSMAVTEDLRKSMAAGGFSLGGNDDLPKKKLVQRSAVSIKGADALPTDSALNGMFSTARNQVIGYLATLLADGNDHIAPFYGKIVSNPMTVMSKLGLDGVKKYLPSDKVETVMDLISSEEARSIRARKANVEDKRGEGTYLNYVAGKVAEYAEKKGITAKLAANIEINTPH